MSTDGQPTDPELFALATRLGQALYAKNRRMVAAESCTGGWVAKVMTDVVDSSKWFDCGFVTYSNTAKMRDLGVSASTLEAHGAVSETTVVEMARGALERTQADVAVSISGIAGPTGGVPGKPVGTVWFAVATRHVTRVTVEARHQLFAGDREAVRRQSVRFALQMVLEATDGADGVASAG